MSTLSTLVSLGSLSTIFVLKTTEPIETIIYINICTKLGIFFGLLSLYMYIFVICFLSLQSHVFSFYNPM